MKGLFCWQSTSHTKGHKVQEVEEAWRTKVADATAANDAAADALRADLHGRLEAVHARLRELVSAEARLPLCTGVSALAAVFRLHPDKWAGRVHRGCSAASP